MHITQESQTNHRPTALRVLALLLTLLSVGLVLVGCGSNETATASLTGRAVTDNETTTTVDDADAGNETEPASTPSADTNETQDTPEQVGQDDPAPVAESPTPATDTEPGPDGEALAPAISADITPQQVALPYVPVVALPDISELDELGTLISAELADALSIGLDVVTVPCSAEGSILYQPEGSFLDIEGGELSINEGGRSIDIEVNDDGSGTYDRSSDNGLLNVEVLSDGSGSYYFSHKGNSVEMQINEDGTGVYTESADSIIEIEIAGNGAGTYYRNDPGSALVPGITEIIVNDDGAGRYTDSRPDFEVEYQRDADGLISYEYAILDPRQVVTLKVLPDGSGSFSSDITGVSITVDVDGSGTWETANGTIDFVTEEGILDPALISVGTFPEFAAVGSFPRLDALPAIQPPCATIIRLDSTLLFDFDSATLRVAAGPVLDQVAQAVAATNRPIEINGHTDSVGADDYNLDLSIRRAEAVREALEARGVLVDMSTAGYGETEPVAANVNADGSDNPAGRQANRRVDIVIRN